MTNFTTITSGKFVTVSFIKKDGSLRTINGRTGVVKYLKGGGRTSSPAQYITIWTRDESNKFNACRLINREKIVSIKAEGRVVAMNENSSFKKLLTA